MVPPSYDEDIEKLLELAKDQPAKPKPIKANPEIDSFIAECKVTSGSKKIPSYIVYYQYVIWKKNYRLVSRAKFLAYFRTKFEKVQTDDGIGYRLNPKGFDLTPQGFFKARALYRKEKDERAKAKTK